MVETTLVDDRNALLDITTLGHADDCAILGQIQDSVLLEDWSDHALNHNGWLGVGVERALFVQLAGEEINTKISVLASLVGLRDADDLARSALQYDKVTNSNEMARDRDGVS